MSRHSAEAPCDPTCSACALLIRRQGFEAAYERGYRAGLEACEVYRTALQAIVDMPLQYKTNFVVAAEMRIVAERALKSGVNADLRTGDKETK